MSRLRRGRGRPRLPPDLLARPWPQADWAVIDVETTGLDLELDEIVSVGVARIHGGAIAADEVFHTRVRPSGPIDPRSVRIHGMTAHDLRDAPTPREAAVELAGWVSDALIVAHAAWIEKAFLQRLAWQADVPLPVPVVDTAALTRACGLDDGVTGREPALEPLAAGLGLPVYTPHHALGDAMTTAMVLLSLLARLGRSHDCLTVADVMSLSEQFRS